jgi:hypothetical protein
MKKLCPVQTVNVIHIQQLQKELLVPDHMDDSQPHYDSSKRSRHTGLHTVTPLQEVLEL